MSTDLRIGILGLGTRTATLAPYLHRPGAGSVVVAGTDVRPDAFARAREVFGDGIALASDHRELLGLGLDAVLVLTPDHLHRTMTTDFLEAGVAVYLDKPMATTIEDCDAILASARETGTKLYVGHNMRHMPVVLRMRELIQDGAIGDVKAIWCRHFVSHGGDYYFKNWCSDRRNTTGLLLQKGVHDIDVIHWLAGATTRRVTGMGGLTLYGDVDSRADNSERVRTDWFSYDNWPPLAIRDLSPVVDVEDLSMLTMRLDNGVYATYEQCHYTPDYWRNYTVIGTEGRLENFGDENGVVRLWNRRRDYEERGDREVGFGGEGAHGGADASIIPEFLSFVRDDGPISTTPVEARDAVAAGVCGTWSVRADGAPQDVPPVAADLAAYFAGNQLPAGGGAP
ncbi:Gfo/Idh/MocA family oxidoreductase [Nocardioides sp. LHD-245]|uniref:Gfo/Idh/MocA family protein n=1 Tax=Nocardioides sp. LHD-245 TaxID=3051387 RepID=UPI0027E18882|nr:Gfo/Idh/MocA family oxidoreductase [Nocardioides sp. LHD-245]